MTVGERIKAARKQKGLTQKELAEILNIAFPNISQYERGERNPKLSTLQRIADALEIPVDMLLPDEVLQSSAQTPPPSSKDGRWIPVLGKVSAGIPLDAIEEIIDYEEIPNAQIGDFFALRIKGNSMEPRIKNGDNVIVHKQATAENGDIVVALINGEEATVKQFIKHDNGISLVPSNPAYSPLFYPWEEVQRLPVQILGRVVELRAKF